MWCTQVCKQAVHAGRLFLVDRSGQTQASISVGEVGIDLLDPDSFALDVLGDIMNGFGGRLFDQLRSKEVCSHDWDCPAWCMTDHDLRWLLSYCI